MERISQSHGILGNLSDKSYFDQENTGPSADEDLMYT